MRPVELDGCRLLIVDRELHESGVIILASGIGEFDGEIFHVSQNDGTKYELSEERWNIVELPLTGIWKAQYPNFDWYLVLPSSNDAPEPGRSTELL